VTYEALRAARERNQTAEEERQERAANRALTLKDVKTPDDLKLLRPDILIDLKTKQATMYELAEVQLTVNQQLAEAIEAMNGRR
jgi:hypothetical protein